MTRKKVWRRVVSATIRKCGKSLLNPYLENGNKWELELEDGRIINYPVRYTPQKGYINRGWTHRRSVDDALPAPKRVLVYPKRDAQ